MDKCLVCLINPDHKCANCGRGWCNPCHRKRSAAYPQTDKCPGRPLYGKGKDGHYSIPIVANTEIRCSMPSPFFFPKAKPKP